MRRAGLVSLAVGSIAYLLVAVAAGATGGASVPVGVKPAIGSRSTTFTVSFRAPRRTSGSVMGGARYELTGTGPSGRRCGSRISSAVGPTNAGQQVRVRLAPPAPSRVWCRGRYAGRLIEVFTPRCPPREACPLFIAVTDVGKFSFRVR